MNGVAQTKFGAEGNCVAACWASLLGVPIERIPDLCVEQQFRAESEFAASLGLALYSVGDVGSGSWDCPGDPRSEAVYMAAGVAARGISHRVLMRDGVLAWDPHPDQSGLDRTDRVILVLGDVVEARRRLVARDATAEAA